MRHLLICLTILGFATLGCEKKKEEPPTASSAVSTNTDAQAVPAASESPPAAVAVKVETPPAPVAPAVADVPKAAEAQAPAPAAASDAAADAKSKLDLVTQYIKDKKYDLAEKLLAELDAHKSVLPTSVQEQITTAQTTLKTAKAASSANDALGGLKTPSAGN